MLKSNIVTTTLFTAANSNKQQTTDTVQLPSTCSFLCIKSHQNG